MPVSTTPLLREANLGVIQGLTRAEVREQFPEGSTSGGRSQRNRVSRGRDAGTGLHNVAANSLTQTVAGHAQTERLLGVGHGGSVRGVIISALGPARYSPIGCSTSLTQSLTILDTGEHAGLWQLNDTCHMQSIRTDEETDEVAG